MGKIALFLFVLGSLSACNTCSESDAMNKMLAMQNVQAKLISEAGEQREQIAFAIAQESGKVSELIAQKDYSTACKTADAFATQWHIDLKEEMKGILTYEDLVKDGGKKGGECSLADAAQRNMEFHGKLQAQVDAGTVDSDVFRRYGEDTRTFATLMSSDPSAVCRKLEELKSKYNVQ